MEQQTTIAEELQHLFSNKLKENPYLTISSLETSNLSRKTIERLLKGETKNPSANTVIESLKVIYTGKSLSEIYEEVENFVLREFLGRILNNNYLDKKFHDDKTLGVVEEYFCNPKYNDLLMYIFSRDVVFIKEVEVKYGTSGIELLSELFEKKILKNENEVVEVSAAINISKDTCKQLISYYAQRSIGKIENDSLMFGYYFLGKAVDKNKVMPQLSKLAKESNRKARDILYAKENRGENLVIWSQMTEEVL